MSLVCTDEDLFSKIVCYSPNLGMKWVQHSEKVFKSKDFIKDLNTFLRDENVPIVVIGFEGDLRKISSISWEIIDEHN